MVEHENDKLVSVLSYIFFIGVIMYFVDKKNQTEMTKFHVKQALNLMIISIGLSIVISIIGSILFFMFFFIPLLNLALLVLWIFGLIHAIKQEQKEIPVIGQFAEKYLSF